MNKLIPVLIGVPKVGACVYLPAPRHLGTAPFFFMGY